MVQWRYNELVIYGVEHLQQEGEKLRIKRDLRVEEEKWIMTKWKWNRSQSGLGVKGTIRVKGTMKEWDAHAFVTFIFYGIKLLPSHSCFHTVFRCVHASLYEGLSVCRSVRWLVRPSVMHFFQTADFEWKRHRIIGKVETLFLDCNNLQKNLKQNFKTKF